MLDPTIMYATIASTGNVLAALAHLLLLVLLLKGRRPSQGHLARLFGWALAAEILRNTADALAPFVGPRVGGFGPPLAAIAQAAWLWFLVHLAIQSRPHAAGSALLSPRLANSAVAAIAAFAIVPALLPHAAALRSSALAILTLVSIGFVTIVYQRTPPDSRWSVKFLALGLASLFAFDLFVLAEASFADRGAWAAARGYASLLVVPLLVATAARNRERWQVDVDLSRRVVFDAIVFAASVIGALASLVLARRIQSIGARWSDVAGPVAMFGSLLIAALLVSSSRLRARL